MAERAYLRFAVDCVIHDWNPAFERCLSTKKCYQSTWQWSVTRWLVLQHLSTCLTQGGGGAGGK